MTYYTSRLGTLILWIILVSCFVFLAIDKTHATMLWAGVTSAMLVLGFLVARKRAPELKQIEKADTEMELILYLAESDSPGGASLLPALRGKGRSDPQGQ